MDMTDESAVCGTLFKGATFFLAREVPQEPLLLVIRCEGEGGGRMLLLFNIRCGGGGEGGKIWVGNRTPSYEGAEGPTTPTTPEGPTTHTYLTPPHHASPPPSPRLPPTHLTLAPPPSPPPPVIPGPLAAWLPGTVRGLPWVRTQSPSRTRWWTDRPRGTSSCPASMCSHSGCSTAPTSRCSCPRTCTSRGKPRRRTCHPLWTTRRRGTRRSSATWSRGCRCGAHWALLRLPATAATACYCLLACRLPACDWSTALRGEK